MFGFQSATALSTETLFLPLLHEIAHGLTQLLSHHQTTLIDLHHLPWSNEDKQRFLELLGQGEVKAELNVLGRSIIRETGLAGVWCIEHYNVEETLMSHLLEITECPTIMRAQIEDIQGGLTQLQHLLSQP